MRFQDYIVRSTQKAMDDVIRAALAVPADRVEWVAMGAVRSTLSQMQELAMAGEFLLPLVQEGVAPAFNEHAREEVLRHRASFDTVGKCVEAIRSSVTELCQAISAFPDERLEEEVALPFGPGTTVTMADVLGLPYWNMVYHLGQINQIQLMLGDREMH